MRSNAAATVAYQERAGNTHEGARAGVVAPFDQLQRQVATCLLFEDTFYQSGSSVAAEIAAMCAKVTPQQIAETAITARTVLGLRHVPLFLAAQIVKRRAEAPGLVASTLPCVIQRPDELSEFLAVHAKVEGVKPSEIKGMLSAQVKRGLARAFQRFGAHGLAKYNRDSAIRLRDVLFLCHPKPKDDAQAEAWKKLAEGTLEAPDTWEVALSSGADKRATWERLLAEEKLGALALLRNLRNMTTAGVARAAVVKALGSARVAGVLPYQFLAALREAPEYAQGIETAMLSALEGAERLGGTTALLVDVSPSMDDRLSERGTLTRLNAAAGLSIYLREVAADVRIFTFSRLLVEVPAHRGLGLAVAIEKSQERNGTLLRAALSALERTAGRVDRVIVVTDEQSQDGIHSAWTDRAYLVNVAPYKPGLDTHCGWTRINGFSERVIDFIRMEEGR